MHFFMRLVLLLFLLTSCSSELERESFVDVEVDISLPVAKILNRIDRISVEGAVAEIKFDSVGNSAVYLDGQIVSEPQSESLKYDLDFDGTHVVWIESYSSNTQTNIYINNKLQDSPGGFNFSPILKLDQLYWLNVFSENHGTYQLCSATIDEIDSHSCQVFSGHAKGLYLWNNQLTVVDFDSDAQLFRVKLFDSLLNTTHQYETSNSIVVLENSSIDSLFEVKSNNTSNYFFWALYKLFNEQYGEPFSYSNDYLGRVTNNQSYRLAALSNLYEVTQDDFFKELYLLSARKIISGLDLNGLLFSKKYSISQNSQIAFAVDNAILWDVILKNIAYFSQSEQSQLLELAQRMIAYYEPNWYENEYRINEQADVDFDGIVMPHNQQAALANVLLSLYLELNDTKYLNRAEKIYNRIISELENYNGVYLWRYWPNAFYEGWSNGKYNSVTRPSYPASTDQLFEDTIHATLTYSFIDFFTSEFSQTNLIDIERVESLITSEANKFSFFISGSNIIEPRWEFLPYYPFVNTEQIRSYYKNDVIRSAPDYDNQLDFFTYSMILKDVKTSLGLQDVVLSKLEINGSLLEMSNVEVRLKVSGCINSDSECGILSWFYEQADPQE